MGKMTLIHLKLNQNELKNFAELVQLKMDKNATYVDLQSLITELAILNNTYSTALNIAADGGSDRVRNKNKAKEDLVQHLTKLAITVELKADGDEEYMVGTGFPLRKPTVKRNAEFLEEPTNFTIANDNRKGAIVLNWNRVEGAVTYAFEEMQESGQWKNGRYCTQTSMVLTGFEPGKQKTFRMKVIGRNTATSEWTEPVSVWIS